MAVCYWRLLASRSCSALSRAPSQKISCKGACPPDEDWRAGAGRWVQLNRVSYYRARARVICDSPVGGPASFQAVWSCPDRVAVMICLMGYKVIASSQGGGCAVDGLRDCLWAGGRGLVW